MWKKTKGEYGYIKKTKKIAFLKLIGFLVIAAVIFGLGLLLNKMSYRNIFTIVAILFVLPWARVVVELVLMFPYKTPERANYDKLKAVVAEDARLASDLVITSRERSMGLDFMVLGNGYIFALACNEKQDVNYIQKYLKDGVYNWSNQYQVKIYKQFTDLVRDVQQVKEKEIPEKERQNVEDYVFSLVV